MGEGGIDEVHHPGPQREAGQPVARHRVRRDDAVRARPDKPLLGPDLVRAGDDEEARVDGAGGKDHVDVRGIRVDRGDDPAGTLQPGVAQGRVVGRIALDDQEPVRPARSSNSGMSSMMTVATPSWRSWRATVAPTRPKPQST